MNGILPIAVLAGGLGTRVRHRSGPSLPKALLPINGIPFIDLKLRELRDGGANSSCAARRARRRGTRRLCPRANDQGLEIIVVHDPPELLGTGGALHHALPELGPEFIVTYGDTLLDVPMDQLGKLLSTPGAVAVMTVLANNDRWETSNVDVTAGWVTAYEKHPRPGTHRYLDYGMLAMRSSAFDDVVPNEAFDLGDILRALASRQMLRAMLVKRRFYDVGNESSIVDTERFLRGVDRDLP